MNKTSKRTGFSLVELLIVVSILAILTSLLLPALGKAREKAKTIFCIGNQKQLGLGFIQYASDHDDILPPNDYKSNEPPTWSSALMGPNPNAPATPWLDGFLFTRGSYTTISLFRCPSQQGTFRMDGQTGGGNGWWILRPHYAAPWGILRRPSEAVVKITAVRNPSRKLLLLDSQGMNGSGKTINEGYYRWYPASSPESSPSQSWAALSMRHGSVLNVLHVAGNAESYSIPGLLPWRRDPFRNSSANEIYYKFEK